MKRFYEILPGTLSWLTFALMIGFSRVLPVEISIFIIAFDLYWLLKTVYLSLHMRATFKQMKRNMHVDWLAKLETEKPMVEGTAWHDMYHIVIFPMYDEAYEVIRESFLSLASARYPKERLIVVLGIEERAGETARTSAKKIEEEFTQVFPQFFTTVHPQHIPGEIPGKGSNESWALVHAQKWVDRTLFVPHDRVIVSSFDVDTQIYPDYFGRLTHAFLTAPHRLRAIYQPIPLFLNNIYSAPSLSRVIAFSSSFWQMIQQSRPERLTTFSSQSIPLKVLEDVGYWDPDIVSEDSRIFWQGYLRYHGDFHVEPLFYPVSMDANIAPTFWGTIKNLYRQQRRWAWGVENIPYMLEGFRNDRMIPRRAKWYWTFNAFEGFHSWATNAVIIFVLGWLPILLGGPVFRATLLSYNLPGMTRLIMAFSMVGIASSAVLSVTLLPGRPEWFRSRHYALFLVEWLLMPFTLIIFGAFPALEAQTRLMIGGTWRLGFWVTPKSRSSFILKHVKKNANASK